MSNIHKKTSSLNHQNGKVTKDIKYSQEYEATAALRICWLQYMHYNNDLEKPLLVSLKETLDINYDSTFPFVRRYTVQMCPYGNQRMYTSMFTVTLFNNLKLLTTPAFNRIKRGEKQCSIHTLKYYTATGTNYCFSQQHK